MNDEDLFALFDVIEPGSFDSGTDEYEWMDVGETDDPMAANVWVETPDSVSEEVCASEFADVREEAFADDGGIFDPIFRIIDDFLYSLGGQEDIVTEHHFTDNGNFDVKNNVIVEGNVADDIHYVDQQTHGSCSLMAQEQFVERYTGQPIPEDYLEWRAEQWGVYDPDLGTDLSGQTMVLEHFNIPHERHWLCDTSDLDEALQSDNDAIISVDAREFIGDPSIPPGSGHAVAVVGRGIDPETHEVKGYYVTDSNVPDAAHFIDAERLENSWSCLGDMIVIPNKCNA